MVVADRAVGSTVIIAQHLQLCKTILYVVSFLHFEQITQQISTEL